MTTIDIHPEGQKVDASRGTEWLGEAWRLFVQAPGIWIAIIVILIVIYCLMAVVPAIGQIATSLLTPVFTAGLMQCSRNTCDNGALRIDQMFAGFRNNTGNLVMVGLLTLIGFALISVAALVVLAIIGGTTLISAIQNNALSSVDVGSALIAILLAVLVWLLLSLPLTMAIWFAAPLVYFDGVTPLNAMKCSFRACMTNWLCLSIYGLVLIVLAVFATIPFALGWLVLLPVVAISLYLSYRDIFHGTAN